MQKRPHEDEESLPPAKKLATTTKKVNLVPPEKKINESKSTQAGSSSGVVDVRKVKTPIQKTCSSSCYSTAVSTCQSCESYLCHDCRKVCRKCKGIFCHGCFGTEPYNIFCKNCS